MNADQIGPSAAYPILTRPPARPTDKDATGLPRGVLTLAATLAATLSNLQ